MSTPSVPGRLIETSSPDSEGTMGGLIEAGRHIARHLKTALDLSHLCSNDPVCAQHVSEDSWKSIRPHWSIIKAYSRDVAPRRSVSALGAELKALPWISYAPVRGQYFGLLREINRSRKAAGKAPVPDSAVRLRRKVVRPFEPNGGPAEPAW